MFNSKKFASVFILISLMSATSYGQMDSFETALQTGPNSADCISKLPECNSQKPSEQDRENKRVYCCYTAAYVRCVQGIIDARCAGTPINQLVQSVETGPMCEGYTFWTPDCLYTNYMVAVIGSAAGLALLLLLILCAVCWCCCCRSKK